jgi:flagellin-like hook-associated protein FlgL
MSMPLSGLAQTLSNSVGQIQAAIVDTQNQLASGTKTLDPAQNGVVTRLSAQSTAWGIAENNIATAQNVITVAESALTSIATIMTQMKSLATQSSSAGLTTSDKTSLNTTFANLAYQIQGLGTNASVNGNNLLSGTTGISVTTGISGNSSTATSTTGVNGIDIPSLATTLMGLSIASGSDSTHGSATAPAVTPSVTGSSTSTEIDKAIFSSMAAGDSVMVGGLTFTANQALTATQAASAFANITTDSATTGPQTTLGSYSGTLASGYVSGANSGPTLGFTYSTMAAVSTLTSSATKVSYADYATQILTAKLSTVSTGQSSLSASATGLKAQNSNAQALQTGLSNTVAQIQNIDATAMQAKLQQLNNQQSIDYYLVSQMNTEAAAILSIFR